MNWCCLTKPLVSLPAEPASDLKHGVYAQYFIGNWSAVNISSLCILVTGTSAVGIKKYSIPSILNMSSSNFGNCPVPMKLVLFAMKGGKTSVYPCSSVWVFKKKFIIALSSLAPNPLYKVNLEPVILPAVSKSNIPRPVPISQCAFPSKSNFGVSPHCLISTLSSSVVPCGTSGWGTLGILIKLYSISPSTVLTCSSIAFILSDNSFSWAFAASTSLPSFISWGIFLDSTFNSFFITSTSLSNSLLLSSNATTASRSNSFSPLLSIAFFMSSKFSLILFISSILLPPIFIL